MDYLKIKVADTAKEKNDCFELRKAVFIEGQNVPEKRERDGLDDNSTHILAYFENNPAGCARIRFSDGAAKIERLAVDEKCRGRDFGKKIMQFTKSYCIKQGVKKIIIHAQYYLKNFYEKFGFKPQGKTFVDAGIKHIEMVFNVDK